MSYATSKLHLQLALERRYTFASCVLLQFLVSHSVRIALKLKLINVRQFDAYC